MTAPLSPPGRMPSPGGAIARFLLGSLLAMAVVVVGGYFAVQSIAEDEARHDSSERVQSLGHLVEAAALSDGVLTEDQTSLRELDDLVVGRVISGSIVRVKIWAADGTILYSDAPELIGRRFKLGAEEREAINEGHTEVELSNLSKPENRLERPAGRLIEAYTRVRTPNGTPVLFEIYQQFSSVRADGTRLLSRLAPPLLGGLLVLAVLQVPLAWSFGRRLRRGVEERTALMSYAVEASNTERQRIAADLHDGVVQDLAGLAFGLAPLAQEADRDGRDDDARVLRDASGRLQQSVRDLRTLLVEIHPPNLESVGLQAALSDLLSPLQLRGVEVELAVETATPHPSDPVLYRVALEAVRNAAEHAEPSRVRVSVQSTGRGRRITIHDDGKGFDVQRRPQAERDGHLGLSLLEASVSRSGGSLRVESDLGNGTTVTAEVPA